jgi:hypothetical protein
LRGLLPLDIGVVASSGEDAALVTVHGFDGLLGESVEDQGACGKREGASSPRRNA